MNASLRIASITGPDIVRLGNTTQNPIAESEEPFQGTREKLKVVLLSVKNRYRVSLAGKGLGHIAMDGEVGHSRCEDSYRRF